MALCGDVFIHVASSYRVNINLWADEFIVGFTTGSELRILVGCLVY